jgi:hypothetical protein
MLHRDINNLMIAAPKHYISPVFELDLVRPKRFLRPNEAGSNLGGAELNVFGMRGASA